MCGGRRQRIFSGPLFRGAALAGTAVPAEVVLGDYQSVKDQPVVAGGLPGDFRHPELRARPFQLIAKPDNVRIVHDRSDEAYGISQLLVNAGVAYEDLGGSLRAFSRGT